MTAPDLSKVPGNTAGGQGSPGRAVRQTIRIIKLWAVAAGVSLGLSGNVSAQFAPPPPTKDIVIYNHSNSRMFVMIDASHNRLNADRVNADLWMQAQFGIATADANVRQFPTTLNYRAYVNLPTDQDPGGIPPNGGSVTITVPFYTQLQFPPIAELGTVNDQFIDWWNGIRIYFFNGPVALNSALITYNLPDGPPQTIKANFGSVSPTCTNSSGNPYECNVTIQTSTINPLNSIPFQLQEYTFGSAEGPPPGGLLPKGSPFSIDNTFVNYNVSALDSVYMPLAMGALGNNKVPYQGSGSAVEDVITTIGKFSSNDGAGKNGDGWPYYVDNYFTTFPFQSIPKIFGQSCSLTPFSVVNPPQAAYSGIVVPGTANLIVESFRGIASSSGGKTLPPPVPPILSSQPFDYATLPGYSDAQCVAPGPPGYTTPKLGTTGQRVADLWDLCTSNSNDTSATCKDVRAVKKLFDDNYTAECANKYGVPDKVSTMAAVYGWVPIAFPQYTGPSCHGGALVGADPNHPSQEFKDANTAYCRLQYNYLTLSPADQSKYTFNPFVKLIHDDASKGGLQSTAYAFSIDDKTAFEHVTGKGIIIAIGGTGGLENQTQAPRPQVAGDIAAHCRGAD